MQVLQCPSLKRGSSAHAHQPGAAGTDILGEIPRLILIALNAEPMAVAPGIFGRSRLPVMKRITPERGSIICRAAARDVMNCDFKSVTMGAMKFIESQLRSWLSTAVLSIIATAR